MGRRKGEGERWGEEEGSSQSRTDSCDNNSKGLPSELLRIDCSHHPSADAPDLRDRPIKVE